MTTTEIAVASMRELVCRLDALNAEARTQYDLVAKAQRETTRLRSALASLDDTASPNVLGFAANVQRALDGLDLALLEASRAMLTVQGARGSFAAQTKGWHDAALAELTPTESRT